MRFQPIIVPRPSAIATAILTTERNEMSSLERSASLSFMRKRIASEATYMSLRVLATAAAGTLARGCVEILLINAARTCPRLSGAPGNGKSVIAHPHSCRNCLNCLDEKIHDTRGSESSKLTFVYQR